MKRYSQEWKDLVSLKTKEAMAREDVRGRHSIACTNRVVSDEGRRKQSIAQKKRFEWDISPSLRPGVGAKISKSALGCKVSTGTRELLSRKGKEYAFALSAEERKQKYGYWAGKVHSEEYKNKMRGRQHTLETRQLLSDVNSKAVVAGKFSVYCYYNEIPMRSREEYLFAEWLDSQGIAWEYQPIIFKMPDGFNYIPDFRIVETNTYVEVTRTLKTKLIGRCAEKIRSFIEAGFDIVVVAPPFDETIQNSILGRSALVREKFVTPE